MNDLKVIHDRLPKPIGDGIARDVNFYDWDGSCLYSYTAEEFLSLGGLPPNPYRRGFIAQGWNWSLEDAQEYVSKYGMLEIGQTYNTADGKTKIRIAPVENFSVSITIGDASTDGQLQIDWGDGEVTEWVTSSNVSGYVWESSAYDSDGNYVFKDLGNFFPTLTHKYTKGEYTISIASKGKIRFQRYEAYNNNPMDDGDGLIQMYGEPFYTNYGYLIIKSLNIADNVVSIDYARFSDHIEDLTIANGLETWSNSEGYVGPFNINCALIYPKTLKHLLYAPYVDRVLSLPCGVKDVAIYTNSSSEKVFRLSVPSNVDTIGGEISGSKLKYVAWGPTVIPQVIFNNTKASTMRFISYAEDVLSVSSGISSIGELILPKVKTLAPIQNQRVYYGVIDLGEDVTQISFQNIYGFFKTIVRAKTPPNLTSLHSEYTRTDIAKPIYVPAESLELYKNATNWKNCKNLKTIESLNDN